MTRSLTSGYQWERRRNDAIVSAAGFVFLACAVKLRSKRLLACCCIFQLFAEAWCGDALTSRYLVIFIEREAEQIDILFARIDRSSHTWWSETASGVSRTRYRHLSFETIGYLRRKSFLFSCAAMWNRIFAVRTPFLIVEKYANSLFLKEEQLGSCWWGGWWFQKCCARMFSSRCNVFIEYYVFLH